MQLGFCFSGVHIKRLCTLKVLKLLIGAFSVIPNIFYKMAISLIGKRGRTLCLKNDMFQCQVDKE